MTIIEEVKKWLKETGNTMIFTPRFLSPKDFFSFATHLDSLYTLTPKGEKPEVKVICSRLGCPCGKGGECESAKRKEWDKEADDAVKHMDKEQLQHLIAVMKSVEKYVGNSPQVFTDAVYWPPAMAMREAADAYERRDALAVEFHKMIEMLESQG